MKVTEHYFPVAVYFAVQGVVLTFESVDENPIAWSFKWKFLSSTFLWCCLLFGEICHLSWMKILDIFGSERSRPVWETWCLHDVWTPHSCGLCFQFLSLASLDSFYICLVQNNLFLLQLPTTSHKHHFISSVSLPCPISYKSVLTMSRKMIRYLTAPAFINVYYNSPCFERW